MSPLAELQCAFAGELLGRGTPALAPWMDRRDLERFIIYRNNVLSNYRLALREVYPVVLRLVGEDFFRQAALAYARNVPSRSGDLNEFGWQFAGFLDGYLPAAGLPYLPDVARLEWAVEQTFHAADSEPLQIDLLAQFPQERWPELRLAMNPAARLVASDYPIVRIWEANQPGACDDVTISLDEAGDMVLVIRRGVVVELERLPLGAFAWLSALGDGATLGHASEQALAAEPAFDLGAALQRHVMNGTLTTASLN